MPCSRPAPGTGDCAEPRARSLRRPPSSRARGVVRLRHPGPRAGGRRQARTSSRPTTPGARPARGCGSSRSQLRRRAFSGPTAGAVPPGYAGQRRQHPVAVGTMGSYSYPLAGTPTVFQHGGGDRDGRSPPCWQLVVTCPDRRPPARTARSACRRIVAFRRLVAAPLMGPCRRTGTAVLRATTAFPGRGRRSRRARAAQVNTSCSSAMAGINAAARQRHNDASRPRAARARRTSASAGVASNGSEAVAMLPRAWTLGRSNPPRRE